MRTALSVSVASPEQVESRDVYLHNQATPYVLVVRDENYNSLDVLLSESTLCAVVEQLMDRYAARDPKAADEFLEHLLRVLSGVSDDAYADTPGPWRAEQ